MIIDNDCKYILGIWAQFAPFFVSHHYLSNYNRQDISVNPDEFVAITLTFIKIFAANQFIVSLDPEFWSDFLGRKTENRSNLRSMMDELDFLRNKVNSLQSKI
jgi:hypothetical protein